LESAQEDGKMIKWFICPDNEKIECEACLKEGGCRMKERCFSRPTLKMMYRRYPINPKKIGTTRLLLGTLQAFLLNKIDYAESPDKMIFMVQGTRQHKELERMGDSISKAEGKYDDTENTIRPDCLETECGITTLWDYKFSGSYQVVKALGMYQEEVPMLDDKGNPVTFKSNCKGGKKGEARTKKVWKLDPVRADVKDWAYQLNNYRIGVEKHFKKKDPKFKVHRLRVEIVIRDGGCISCLQRGISRKGVVVEVPIYSDKETKQYFDRKRKALRKALAQDYWDIPCNDHERWENDHRCKEFCPVNHSCPYYLENYVKQAEVEQANETDCDEVGDDGCPTE